MSRAGSACEHGEVLTDDQLRFWDDNGYLVLEEFVDRRRCERLRERALELVARATAEDGAAVSMSYGRQMTDSPGVVRIVLANPPVNATTIVDLAALAEHLSSLTDDDRVVLVERLAMVPARGPAFRASLLDPSATGAPLAGAASLGDLGAAASSGPDLVSVLMFLALLPPAWPALPTLWDVDEVQTARYRLLAGTQTGSADLRSVVPEVLTSRGFSLLAQVDEDGRRWFRTGDAG